MTLAEAIKKLSSEFELKQVELQTQRRISQIVKNNKQIITLLI